MAIMKLHCAAIRRGSRWEAICLDFDIAVQGSSFDEVRKELFAAVDFYLESVGSYDQEQRKILLNRRAPFYIWLRYWLAYVMDALSRKGDDGHLHGFTTNITCPV